MSYYGAPVLPSMNPALAATLGAPSSALGGLAADINMPRPVYSAITVAASAGAIWLGWNAAGDRGLFKHLLFALGSWLVVPWAVPMVLGLPKRTPAEQAEWDSIMGAP